MIRLLCLLLIFRFANAIECEYRYPIIGLEGNETCASNHKLCFKSICKFSRIQQGGIMGEGQMRHHTEIMKGCGNAATNECISMMYACDQLYGNRVLLNSCQTCNDSDYCNRHL